MAALGVLLCLCGPMTDGGLHHVAVISPDGYYRLEHASYAALQTPFARADLTGAASATVDRLLECPEYCCASRAPTQRPPSRIPPPRFRLTPSSLPRLSAYFPPFPLSLPADVYRAPTLTAVLAATPMDEMRMWLVPGARPLVSTAPLPAPGARLFPSPSGDPWVVLFR